MTHSRRWLVIASAMLVTSVAAAPAVASDPYDKGKDLEVYKTAQGTFDRAFNWRIEKWADKSYVKSYDKKVEVNYKVKVSKSRAYDSDFAVSGEIKVFNPNKKTAKYVQVYDKIGYNDCKVWGGDSKIYGYSWTKFYYVCYVDDFYAGGYGKNVATVKWDSKSIKSPHDRAYAQAYFKFDKPKYVKNDCTSVKDTLEDYTTLLGDSCYLKTFYYKRYLEVPKYGCKDFVNYATETASYSTASAKVTVCRKDRKDGDG